jgi:tetratricopeptide (TPR) repeat protein
MDSKTLWERYYTALKQQEWSKALGALTSIKEIKQFDSQVYLKTGDILQRMGDTAGAIGAYHKAAIYLVKEGFMQKAAAIFKIILRLDPNNSEASVKLQRVIEVASTAKGAFSQLASPKVEEFPPASDAVPASIGLFDPSKALLNTGDATEPLETKEYEDFDDLLAEASKELPLTEEGPRLSTGLPAVLMPIGEKQATEIAGRAAKRAYKKGERIIKEGDTGDSLFFIKQGTVKVVAHILGKEFVLTTLGDGDVFGEVTFLTGRPRTASVVADGDVEILEFNRSLLEEAISRNPEVLECLNDLYDTRVSTTLKKIGSD